MVQSILIFINELSRLKNLFGSKECLSENWHFCWYFYLSTLDSHRKRDQFFAISVYIAKKWKN